MCGDGRLVDIRAYVDGWLGGIEAGACGAYGFAFAFNLIGASPFFLSLLSTYYVRSYRMYHWYDV